jgi:predicted N-acetyltransferase YhbS
MLIRKLARKELKDIWTIDRREVIDHIYYLRDGKLVLEAEHYDLQGWPFDATERLMPGLLDCFDRGGYFWGGFEKKKLVGIVVLDSKFIGSQKDGLELKFLHVSHGARKQGLGKVLFETAANQAKEMGATKMYISAIPSENTVDFYQYLGCVLAKAVDPEMLARQPDDIQLEYVIP